LESPFPLALRRSRFAMVLRVDAAILATLASERRLFARRLLVGG